MIKKLAFVLVILVVAAGVAFWFNQKKQSQPVLIFEAQDEDDRLNKLFEADLKRLDDPNTPPLEFQQTLPRLAEKKVPRARQLTLEYVQSADSTLRVAAALSLKFLEGPEVEKAQWQLLHDSNPQVQRAAVMSFYSSLAPYTPEKVMEFENEFHNNKRVQLYIKMAILSFSSHADKKEKALNELVQSAWANEVPADDLNMFYLDLMARAPMIDGVLDLLAKKTIDTDEPYLLARVLMHLSRARPAIFNDKLYQRFFKHPHLQVRLNLMQTIFIVCPKNYRSLIEQILKTETDRSVIQLLWSQMALLNPQVSSPLFEMIKTEKLYKSEEKPALDQFALKASQAPSPYACEN